MGQVRLLGFAVVVAAALIMLGPAAAIEPQSRVGPDPIAATQAYLRAHPEDGRTWAVLGNAYAERVRRTGDAAYADKARRALRKSLKLLPDNVDALVGLGALANTLHRFEDGLAWGIRARRADAERSGVYGVLVDAFAELGRYDHANRALDRMLDLRPDVASFTRAAHLLELRGEHDRAAEALRRAVEAAADPFDLAFCHFRRGELNWRRGDRSAAQRDYQLALAADGGFAPALAGLGRVQAAQGLVDEAVGSYTAAIARQPAPPYVLELGGVLAKAGRHEAARAQFAQLRAMEPDDLTLGRYETAHGDPGRAVQRLSEEWRRRPTVEVARAFADALRAAGREHEAARLRIESLPPERENT